MLIQRFILNQDGSVSEEPNLLAWMNWFDQANPLIAHNRLLDGTHISTVFLGINRNYGSGSPLLFETMVIGGPHTGYLQRYGTKEEALEGHAKAVRIAQGKAGAA